MNRSCSLKKYCLVETPFDQEPEEKKDVSEMTSEEFQEYKEFLETLYHGE